jgi:hypothetical protein
MRRLAPIAPLLLVGVACAHLPELTPFAEDGKAVAEKCRSAFPHQPWRATHTIFATLPFGAHGALVGVTAVDPGGLRAVLLSPEGISLFDGLQNNRNPLDPKLRVDRAVPPFDRPAFAAGLMADVGHAFLPPAGEPTVVGRDRSGATVCRWIPERGDSTDVQLGPDGPRAIRTFNRTRLSREISLLGTPTQGLFPLVILSVPGTGGYGLEMRLVDHE